MLLSIKANNCFIYNSDMEFSMQANMHSKRFPNNVASFCNTNILKTAVVFGPNNSGKTKLVKTIELIRDIMLGKAPVITPNFFTNSPIVELSVTFIENGTINLFELKYDVSKGEYIFERFAHLKRDKHKNITTDELLLRDSIHKLYKAKDDGLSTAMGVASRGNIIIHLVNADEFPFLKTIKDTLISFASRIDIVDMNNIPIRKTLELLKASPDMHRKIANFVRNADLYMDDFMYLNDEQVRIELEELNITNGEPQEQALTVAASLTEMLHLASVYKGMIVPSLVFDSTGTKKMAALASYVIDALENGRILIIDELDNSLHFRLTRAVIALFNNELNTNAQLIATAHDISLLDCHTLFRKEQIWFAHKDKENVYLYSLVEFTAEKSGVRDTSDIIEKYRKGVFGALPEPDLFQTLLEVKDDE